jgi:hypothetical protein
MAAHCRGSPTVEVTMDVRLSGLEFWRTEHLLMVYERLFGCLEAKSRQRIIETARLHGRDRTWQDRAA